MDLFSSLSRWRQHLSDGILPGDRGIDTEPVGISRLTDLADEILLQIASYLEPEPQVHVGPFYRWSEVLRAQIGEARSANQSINALSLSCKRLHDLFTPMVYTRIPLTEVSIYHKPQLSQLLRTFETNESLADHVAAATAPGTDSSQFYSLFWLPNVQTLSIQEFNGADALEWEDQDHVGTSPVRTLRLARCGAWEEALKEVLSWPSALEELWYEVEDIEWSARYEGDRAAVEFTSSAVERCLASHIGSLEKLVFSRSVQPHEGLGYSDVIDLRKYEKLRSLSINHVFLIGWDQDTNVWERLPKSLVELDVFYDDAGYINFVHGDAVRPGWLFGLLEKKWEFFPALERVRILSLEWHGYDFEGEDEDQEEGSENNGSGQGRRAWNPSTELTRAFAEADVSFSVFLHEDRRFKYVAGGKGWEDNWEETLKSSDTQAS